MTIGKNNYDFTLIALFDKWENVIIKNNALI